MGISLGLPPTFPESKKWDVTPSALPFPPQIREQIDRDAMRQRDKQAAQEEQEEAVAAKERERVIAWARDRKAKTRTLSQVREMNKPHGGTVHFHIGGEWTPEAYLAGNVVFYKGEAYICPYGVDRDHSEPSKFPNGWYYFEPEFEDPIDGTTADIALCDKLDAGKRESLERLQTDREKAEALAADYLGTDREVAAFIVRIQESITSPPISVPPVVPWAKSFEELAERQRQHEQAAAAAGITSVRPIFVPSGMTYRGLRDDSPTLRERVARFFRRVFRRQEPEPEEDNTFEEWSADDFTRESGINGEAMRQAAANYAKFRQNWETFEENYRKLGSVSQSLSQLERQRSEAKDAALAEIATVRAEADALRAQVGEAESILQAGGNITGGPCAATEGTSLATPAPRDLYEAGFISQRERAVAMLLGTNDIGGYH